MEISGCRAGNQGGAFFVTDINLNIADLRFHNNSAATGGAIATIEVPTAQIRRSRFAANFATPTPHPSTPPDAHHARVHTHRINPPTAAVLAPAFAKLLTVSSATRRVPTVA